MRVKSIKPKKRLPGGSPSKPSNSTPSSGMSVRPSSYDYTKTLSSVEPEVLAVKSRSVPRLHRDSSKSLILAAPYTAKAIGFHPVENNDSMHSANDNTGRHVS